jgi:asparagine synthase (glutamine-hydrolysing)
MCGITGIIGSSSEAHLVQMTQLLYHRGPDDGAIWFSPDKRAGLGHRRLSILDLSSAGRQPMQSTDGRFCITYNGEIFNYRELRSELHSKGYRFNSQTDTEVLLYGFAEWGSGILDRLNGQFAFGIWDNVDRTLFLARDHFGIKPIYFYHTDDSFYFASEAKSILAVCEECREPNWNALPHYFSFLWNPKADTFFSGINKLLPGQYLVLKQNSYSITQYFNVSDFSTDSRSLASNYEERASEIRNRISISVQSQLVSDVPVGLLLSGGLDSTVMLSAMKDSDIRSFTASYSSRSRAADVFEDDLKYARMASQHFGTELIEEELQLDITSQLETAVWHLDEPMADPTVITNLEMTRLAKKQLTVLLSGMGADEIFGGYPRYPATLFGNHASKFPSFGFRFLASLMAKSGSLLSMRKKRRAMYLLKHMSLPFRERFIGYSSYADDPMLKSLISSDLVATTQTEHVHDVHHDMFDAFQHASPLKQMLLVDIVSFMPFLNLENMDKTSMANSVEMRVPFLDLDLVRYVLQLPDKDLVKGMNRKRILRSAYEKHIPVEIIHRKKTGYSPPVRGWVQHELRDFIHDSLLTTNARIYDVVQFDTVKDLVEKTERQHEDHTLLIWSLLVLETWLKTFSDTSKYQLNQHHGLHTV